MSMPENSCDVNYYQNVFALMKEADGIARDLRVAVLAQRAAQLLFQQTDPDRGLQSGSR